MITLNWFIVLDFIYLYEQIPNYPFKQLDLLFKYRSKFFLYF